MSRKVIGMQRWIRIFRPFGEFENYQLALRCMKTAWIVRRWLQGEGFHPGIQTAIAATERAYLPRQRNWRISDSNKIHLASRLIVRFPYRWGACVHQSLIAYRLLNGYGFPSEINLGISRGGNLGHGHAWVSDAGNSEISPDSADFKIIYRSHLPPC